MVFEEINKAYGIDVDFQKVGNGHINSSFCSSDKKWFLQVINTYVFKDPKVLMENIDQVTTYLRKQLKAEGKDERRGTLKVVPTLDGRLYVTLADGRVFRIYENLTGVKSLDYAESLKDSFNVGMGFGQFQRMLKDYPIDTLKETIPMFHNTVNRVKNFKNAIAEDKMGRLAEVKDEVDKLLAWSVNASKVLDEIEKGTVPLAVTHNDTKINNLMLDEKTGEPICVIDLDTVMPGSRIYDYGECLRLGAVPAPENETDLNKIQIDKTAWREITRGYFSEAGNILTDKECELLVFGVQLMSYENSIRFMTDYLEGDVYFGISYPTENRVRSRAMYEVVQKIEAIKPELEKIVAEAKKEFC